MDACIHVRANESVSHDKYVMSHRLAMKQVLPRLVRPLNPLGSSNIFTRVATAADAEAGEWW